MTSRAPRVVVFRSSRYLALAVQAAQACWPGCEITVVHQPSAHDEARQWGRPLVFDAATHFRVVPWIFSRTRRVLRAWRPDRAVIQLPDSSGAAALQLQAVALMTGRGHATFVRPDGTLHHFTTRDWVTTAGRRLWWSTRNALLIAAIAAATVLATPAWLTARLVWRLRDKGLLPRPVL